MTVVLVIVIVVAVICLFSTGVALGRARKAETSVAGLRRELDEAQSSAAATSERSAAEVEAARTEAANAQAEAEAARVELAAARTSTHGTLAATPAAATEPAAAQPAATEASAAPTLDALWSLARIREGWQRRQVAGLGGGAAEPEGTWSGITFAEMLEDEVARLREEGGTPGSLRNGLEAEPPPGQAVLLLAGIQALLEALARHCQAYDLYVHLWEQRLTAIMVCEDFDGPDRVINDTGALLDAIAPAGGDLALDQDERGRLRARLTLPLPSQPA